MDQLLTFAELAIGLAGVAAIVMMIRDFEKEDWNKFQFTGLIGHSTMAMTFSLLPFIVHALAKDLTLTWTLCSVLLAVQIAIQVTVVPFLDKNANLIMKVMLVIFGYFTACVLVLNSLNIYFNRSIEAYYVGILFHLIQGGFLFFIFIADSPLLKTSIRRRHEDE